MLLWASQFITSWFGITNGDKALYSIVTVILLILGCASTYVGNAVYNKGGTFEGSPAKTIAKITFLGVIVIIVIIMVLNGTAMMMSTQYEEYANDNEGVFTGFRQLTSVTSEDVNSLANFGLGIREIVKSMFLIVPCLIATWGGLGVLTAESISDAEGGILAIVAAFVVFIVVWIFKAIDVTIMLLILTPNLSVFTILALKITLKTILYIPNRGAT